MRTKNKEKVVTKEDKRTRKNNLKTHKYTREAQHIQYYTFLFFFSLILNLYHTGHHPIDERQCHERKEEERDEDSYPATVS